MLPSDIAAIEKRANDASPGPWEMEYTWVERDVRGTSYVVNGPSESWIDVGYEEDAEFIAHARADIPALVGELRAERTRNETLANALDALIHHTWLCEEQLDQEFGVGAYEESDELVAARAALAAVVDSGGD